MLLQENRHTSRGESDLNNLHCSLTTTIAATSRIASCKKRSMIMAVIWTQFYNRSDRTLLVTMTYVVVQITIYWLVDWYHSTFKITFNCTNSN